MTISAAIDKLFFVESVDYGFYLDCLLSEEELREEREEVEEARKTLADAFIEFSEEIIQKKRQRRANKIPEPIRFIDRPHFVAVDTDDLPF